MKNKFLRVLIVLLIFSGIAFGVYRWTQREKKPLVVGDLQVLKINPDGKNLPISTEGITVMFDHPMIPLTTIDEGQKRAIPIKITPETPGKFSWLGTRGFIFRPEKPFDPATTYKVEIPAGPKDKEIISVDGYKLKESVRWEFTTVRPKLRYASPSEASDLPPEKIAVFLDFNLPMNRKELEEKLSIKDFSNDKALQTTRRLIWEENGHRLKIQFEERLPFGTQIGISIPAGVHAEKGDIGLSDPVSISYRTPDSREAADTLEILTVSSEYYENYYPEGTSLEAIDKGLEQKKHYVSFYPDKESLIKTGQNICFSFNQGIDTKTFEAAFSATVVKKEPSPETQASSKSPKFSFYYSDHNYFSILKEDGRMEDRYGPAMACVGFTDGYDQLYRFGIDSQKLIGLFGAKLKEQKNYLARTEHAIPSIEAVFKKPILSANGSLTLPYSGINLKSAEVRIYPISKIQYNEYTLGRSIGRDSKEESNYLLNDLSLPIDPKTKQINTQKMKPLWTSALSFEAKPNVETPINVDLTQLSPVSKPGTERLVPGLYLFEVIGVQSKGERREHVYELNPLANYSILQITPVALAVKQEVDHTLVWATDIETGQPISDLSVSLEYGSGEDSTIDEVVTNEQGVAIVDDNSHSRLCVTVKDPKRFSYSCPDNHSMGQYYKDYRSSLSGSENNFAYVYTDRPVYRPGQEVFFSAFVRDVKEGRYFMPPKDAKVSVQVFDASGEEIYKEEGALLEKGGVVKGKLTLKDSEDLPRGGYTINLTTPSGQLFSRVFQVTSYRKPSFKVDLKTDTPEISSLENLSVDVHGTYFFGAPMRDAKASWSIMTQTYLFKPKGYEGFSFIDEDLLYKREHGDETFYYGDYEYDTVAMSGSEPVKGQEDWSSSDYPSGDLAKRDPGSFLKNPSNEQIKPSLVRLDQDGHLTIRYTPDLKNYATSQKLSVEVNVTDPANQQVSSAEDLIVHKGDFYLGLKTGKWVYGEKEKVNIDLVSVSKDGKAAPNTEFTVDVIYPEYKYVQKKNLEGDWVEEYSREDTVLKTISQTTDSEGKAAVSYEIPKAGFYRIVAKGKDAKSNEVQSATAFFAWGEGYVPWKLDQPSKIEMVPDKESYKIGDTAKILIKSIVPPTRALMTLERGRVLEYQIIELGGNADHLEIPITEGMRPNLYVNLVAHAGRDGNRPPMLLGGEVELKIEPESKRLKVEISSDRKGSGDLPPIYRPGEEVKLEVQTKDPSGNPIPAHVMISVADDSVLRLLDYQLPDLVEKFYYNRRNGVVTSSSLTSLKAGDGESGGVNEGKKRRIFKDTAHFEGHLITDQNGKGTLSFKLPDDLTTWTIEALAISNSKSFEEFENERLALNDTEKGHDLLGSNLTIADNTYVGGVRSQVMTTLPLVLRSALPRFVAWEDEVHGQVIANNRNPEPVEGTLFVKLSGDANFENGGQSVEIPFLVPAKTEKAFPIKLKASYPKEGRFAFSAEAKSKEGKILDSFEIAVPVKDRFSPEVVATSGMTQENATEQVDLSTDAISKDKGDLTVNFRSSLALASAPAIQRMITYPYGCAEQRSARLLSLMMLRELTSNMDEAFFDQMARFDRIFKNVGDYNTKRALLDRLIQEGIDELVQRYQDPNDGGIRYWPSIGVSHTYSSAQVLWAFSLAKRQGFKIPEDPLKKLTNYIGKDLEFCSANPELPHCYFFKNRDERAYRGWVLSEAGATKTDLSFLLPKLVSEREELSVTGLSYLLMALKNAGFDPNDQALISKRLLTIGKEEPRHMSWSGSDFFWSSAAKNTALAGLALFTENPQNVSSPRALAFLFNRKKVKQYYPSTQDDLYTIAFVNAYSAYAKEKETAFKAFMKADGKLLVEMAFTLKNLFEVPEKKISIKELSQMKNPLDLAFEKIGTGTLYYDLVLKYYLPPKQTPPREEGILVTREYYDLNDIKEEKPLSKFKVGENYRAHLTLIVPQDLNYVLVQDLLPAGFEAIDMTLATSSRAAELQSKESEETTDSETCTPETYWDCGFDSYDDEIPVVSYESDYAFPHQEIHDDLILWSDQLVRPGVYHLRYPVRATSAGKYLMPGAEAFEFYEPEIFGRSRMNVIEITE